MPRTSTAPEKHSRRINQGAELAHHKAKIRSQKEEIDKLKRSIKAIKAEAK
jgi:polyhydroxyalkanoate synthesis regulator phasin